MSVDKPRCEFKPRFVAERAAFDRHEKTLLDILRKVHRGGPKSEPFDADEASNNLGNIALWRFEREIFKRKTVLPARRVERLRDLAKALGRARHEAHKAMQDDVGAALFWGWHAEAKEGLLEHLSSFSLKDKIEEIVARLAHLESRSAQSGPRCDHEGRAAAWNRNFATRGHNRVGGSVSKQHGQKTNYGRWTFCSIRRGISHRNGAGRRNSK